LGIEHWALSIDEGGTSMPVKKSIRRKKSTVRNSVEWASTPVAWTRTSIARLTKLATSMDRSMVAAVLLTGGIVVALLLAGYRTTPPAVATAGDQADTAIVTGDPVDAPRIAAAPSNTPAVSESRLSSVADVVAAPQIVTIAGCLAQDGESFRLKDTSGADVPRSRNWKSGFLKKSPAAVEVVDASHRLKLTNHVGERVSVTGTITDGEMQARSLRRVANSCSDSKPKVNA
jgi:hypothetical protein